MLGCYTPPASAACKAKPSSFRAQRTIFFRNRLTHSLEVAQIGKTIAAILNAQFYKRTPRNAIDLDLIEFACLAHDLGHPPFGHIGEDALDECMKEYGGFEGNAQSFRIVSRLEKKELQEASGAKKNVPIVKGRDLRVGLNVTYRSLAAILKYDRLIPPVRNPNASLVKGYYYFDEELIKDIKEKILGPQGENDVHLRTIECSIMDTADDIAYSTYDLEDAFKSNIVTPLGLWLLSRDDRLMRQIAKKVSAKIKEFYPEHKDEFSDKHVIGVMYDFFQDMVPDRR